MSHSEESDVDNSGTEEPEPEEFEPEESDIQPLIRAEQGRFEKRRGAERDMTYIMYRELRCGRGPWEYKPVEYKPVEADLEESDLEDYEQEDEPDKLVARQLRQDPESPVNSFPILNILHRGSSIIRF